MVNRTCETCRYGDFGQSGYEGRCRRLPPVATLAYADTDPRPVAIWPTVKTSDWCGEHQPKHDAKP